MNTTDKQTITDSRTVARKTIGANGVKIGDTLTRVDDHLGRPNHSVKITGKRLNPAVYDLEGYWRKDETAKSLSAQGYRLIERNGQTLTFFVRYW